MPRVEVPLTPAGAFLVVVVAASPRLTTPSNPPRRFRALTDTGADMTAISPEVVGAIRPMRIGDIPVARPAGGHAFRPTYDIRLGLGQAGAAASWVSLEVVEAPIPTPGVGVLIGMDLLSRVDMEWSGPRRRVVIKY